jgi:hypothetical protein
MLKANAGRVATKLRSRLMIASIAGALSIVGCGGDEPATGGDGGSGGYSGDSGIGGHSGSGGGNLGSGGSGGSGGSSYQVCTLGLCMEDETLAASCLDVYDGCVGRGHYPRSCRMDADKTCGVFGQTGPY